MEVYQDLVSLVHFPTSHFLQMPTCVNALELLKSWIMDENQTLRNFEKVGQSGEGRKVEFKEWGFVKYLTF